MFWLVGGKLSRHHLAGVGLVWLCEGPLHRRSQAERRVAEGLVGSLAAGVAYLIAKFTA
jgi:hypothetical protein